MQQARRYEFHELLGRGGMGEVYRGTAVGVHGFTKQVAIKRLVRELANSREFVERLVDEAKLLSALQHSNLVSVLDLGRSADDVFIALEYVDGPDLGTLLKAGPLPLGLACFVVRSACEGVAFAHERPQPVIHADLSPSNVLLSRAGEVKVTDFGIARRIDGRRQPSGVEGKWPYMAPEQVQAEPLTPQSDVFSMGIVLYQVLVGQRPFRGKTVDELRDEICGSDPISPRELRPEIPETLEWLCLRSLHKEPAERFESMRAVGKALGEVAFSSGWRDGAAELAASIAQRCPPLALRSTASRKIMLAELGVGEAEQTRETAAERPGAVASEAPTVELTGSVVAPTSSALDGLTRWTVKPKRGVPWRAMTYVAVVALLTVAVGMFVLRSPQRGAPATVTVDSAPPAVVSKPDAAEPPARDASPAAVEAVDAARALDARVRVRPSPRRGRGTLRLHADPWGYVWIDGRKTGKSTPSVHRVRAGRRKVRITSPSTGLARTLIVGVKAGQTVTRSVKLTRDK